MRQYVKEQFTKTVKNNHFEDMHIKRYYDSSQKDQNNLQKNQGASDKQGDTAK